MKTIRDIDVKGKTVLVRVDYNVPMKDGVVTDDLRMRASVPTLAYLRAQGAKKIILISHLGRPEGKDEKLSLKPVAEKLKELLAARAKAKKEPSVAVDFVGAVAGPEVVAAVAKMPEGGILVLENLRFWPGEEANDSEFIREIIEATGAEVFVQDGFAVVHRAHASTSAVAEFLPVCAGLLLEKEIKNLRKVLEAPERPFVVVVGGAKVADKQPLIEKFATMADQVAVGGKIAVEVREMNNAGASVDDSVAGSLGADDLSVDGLGAETKTTSVHFPENVYVAEDFDEDETGAKLDVGPVSTTKIATMVTDAKTVIWNGLLGKAEDPAYSTASTIVAELMGEKEDVQTVVCGGDTTGFVEELMRDHPNLKYSLVSTGGGAALEFLLGNELPGLAVVAE